MIPYKLSRVGSDALPRLSAEDSRRFARAVRTQESEELARLHFERYAANRLRAARIRLFQILDLDDVIWHVCSWFVRVPPSPRVIKCPAARSAALRFPIRRPLQD